MKDKTYQSRKRESIREKNIQTERERKRETFKKSALDRNLYEPQNIHLSVSVLVLVFLHGSKIVFSLSSIFNYFVTMDTLFFFIKTVLLW